MASSYLISFVISIAFLSSAAYLVLNQRKELSEMAGMMAGMAFGMLTGLVTATLYLIPTGDFLYGTIYGSIVGLLFGVFMGWLGGPMGIMEGVMAGPMGGMMGAMLGQMIRPFSLDTFMIFFFLLQGVSVSCLLYCLPKTENKTENSACCKKEHNPIIGIEHIIAVCLLFIIAAALLFSKANYSLSQSSPQAPTAAAVLELPPSLREATKEVSAEAVLDGEVQKVKMQITALGYRPNLIIAKKGIPLVIEMHADENAGCAREIVFPDFNIRKIVPAGGSESVRLELPDKGKYRFHCSMDMVKGTIIVE